MGLGLGLGLRVRVRVRASVTLRRRTGEFGSNGFNFLWVEWLHRVRVKVRDKVVGDKVRVIRFE